MEETFGQRLSRIRKEKGLTQEDIAKRIVISPQAVSKWENDVSSPDILVLSSLADILGVSVDELLGRENPKSETVDSEVVDDEEKMSESEPEEETDEDESKKDKKSRIHIKDGDDEIIIDSHGVHLKDGEDTVDISGNININGNDGSVYIDDDGVHVYDKNGRAVHTPEHWGGKWYWIFFGSLSGLTIIAYILIGVLLKDQYIGWKAGWIILFLPTIVSSLFDAIFKRRITHFAYPILITAVYLALGFSGDYLGFEGWGFYWFLFLTIPAFYLIAGPIDSRLRHHRIYVDD